VPAGRPPRWQARNGQRRLEGPRLGIVKVSVVKDNSGFSLLKQTVIDRGLCTGCGTCASVCPRQLIEFRYVDGEPEPHLAEASCSDCTLCFDTCPGQDVPMLAMEAMAFGTARNPGTDEFGIYRKCFIAHAGDEMLRQAGGSGGSVSAILAYALDTGLVDAAIVTGFSRTAPYRPEPKLVTHSKELSSCARSKHGGAVPTNSLLHRAVVDDGMSKLAMVGLPCHVHGVRKVQLLRRPGRIARSVGLVLGLFCGSQFYFEATRHLLLEWCGLKSLDEVAMIDYRWGDWPGGFYVRTTDGRELRIDRFDYTFHKFISYVRDRCTVCIDHGAELADISFGDYWYPGCQVGDPGWNVVLVRSDAGMRVLEAAVESRYLVAQEASTDQIARSGREVKRHSNPFRAGQRRRYGMPVPDFGFTLGHEPQPEPQRHTMPRR